MPIVRQYHWIQRLEIILNLVEIIKRAERVEDHRRTWPRRRTRTGPVPLALAPRRPPLPPRPFLAARFPPRNGGRPLRLCQSPLPRVHPALLFPIGLSGNRFAGDVSGLGFPVDTGILDGWITEALCFEPATSWQAGSASQGDRSVFNGCRPR